MATFYGDPWYFHAPLTGGTAVSNAALTMAPSVLYPSALYPSGTSVITALSNYQVITVDWGAAQNFHAQQQAAHQASLERQAFAQRNYDAIAGRPCTPDQYAWYQQYAGLNPFVETPEQHTARQAAAQAHAAKLTVVRQKAERLWLAQLTPDERTTWIAEGYVLVRSEWGHLYKIRNHRNGNVYRLSGTPLRETRKYCVYGDDPGGALPNGDYWFVQLVTLKYNEREFLAKANTWDLLREGVFVGQGIDALDEALPLAA
jgi:hypothetical protein